LEAQVESGKLKLVEEKRIINEITSMKRNRKTVEQLAALQKTIDAEKTQADVVRKRLDDFQEGKTLSDEYNTVQARLNSITQAKDAEYAHRGELFDKRNEYSDALNAEYAKKRELVSEFRKQTDEFYQWQREEQARKQEQYRVRKQQEDMERKKEIAEKELEAASIPVFVEQINSCDILIGHLKALTGEQPTAKEQAAAATIGKPLAIRTVSEDNVPKGTALLKKKDRDEEEYFGAKKTPAKKNKKPSGKKDSGESKFSLSLGVIERLIDIQVDLPVSMSDVPKTIEAIQAKRKWYLDNQDKLTAEKKLKAEKKVAVLLGKAEAAKVEEKEEPEAVQVEA
jgi:hypothetical protein